ncbi:hypothetical protein M9Y10_021017 [Tritrichomonas musculus]|uniref:Uncharacterized protein n=1 Tax=Tritrichomonas musculus TaxID=1915356 RepID=A0ABR2GMH7_9EUKA
MSVDGLTDDPNFRIPDDIAVKLIDIFSTPKQTNSNDVVADIETIYSISDISFYNKGSTAKNKILTDPLSMFSSSKTQGAQQCNLSKSKKGQIKIIVHSSKVKEGYSRFTRSALA